MPYKYNRDGRRVSKKSYNPYETKRRSRYFSTRPTDHYITITWARGEMRINQRWLETTTKANLRKFISISVALMQNKEEKSNGRVKKKN